MVYANCCDTNYIFISVFCFFYNNLDVLRSDRSSPLGRDKNFIQQLAPESTSSGAQRKYNSLPRQEVDCRGMLLVYVVVVVVKHTRAFTLFFKTICVNYIVNSRCIL